MTTICPGFIRTPMSAPEPIQDAVPSMEPDDAARRIVETAIAARAPRVRFPLAAGHGGAAHAAVAGGGVGIGSREPAALKAFAAAAASTRPRRESGPSGRSIFFPEQGGAERVAIGSAPHPKMRWL